MISYIILMTLFIKWMGKLYNKAAKHNLKIVGNYLYEIIRAANRS